MKDMIRVLHAADLHLDSPFEALSEIEAAQRRKEQRTLLFKLCVLAERESADMLLMAGDLLDSDSAYSETADAIEQTIGRLKIPVFIAPGNHDYFSRRSPYFRLDLKRGAHIFKSEKIECVELPELGARVWGAGFEDTSCHSLIRGFRADKIPGTIDIMVIHGDALSKDSTYNPVSEDDIAGSNMDYIALGHTHAYGGLRLAGATYYAWPGCTEGRGFDELGEKGVIIADIRPGAVEAKFVPLGGRKYEVAEIDVSGSGDPVSAILSALPQDTSKDIYRIILKGGCVAPPDTDGIMKALGDRFYMLQLKDKTTIRRELWEKTGEDTLRGLFLTRMREMFDRADSEQEKEKIIQAARWGLAALNNSEELYRA
jgi:exonuclease SbcD